MESKKMYKRFRRLFPNFYRNIQKYESDVSNTILIHMKDGAVLEYGELDGKWWLKRLRSGGAGVS